MLVRPLRHVFSFALIVAAFGVAAAGVDGKTPALRFTDASQRTVAGQVARVAIAVRQVGARCSVVVRYADGTRQPGLKPRRAAKGRARWSWRVPVATPAGPARVTVACGRVGRRSRVISVLKAPVPASVAVEKQGFSQRNSRSGTTSSVSYGILLANPSPDQDALEVTVLINAVDAADRVVQTKTERLDAIASGTTFALGGHLTIAGTTPVSRLELVVRMGARAPKAVRYPTIANVRIVASATDKGFVKAVEGELVNELRSLVLSRASLSVVLFDTAGNVVGGGSGSASAELPPGARTFFSATSGLSSVAVDRGTLARVSVQPSYEPMG